MMSMSSWLFNPIDMGAAALMLFGLLMGLRRGIVGEAFRLFNALVVSLCALRFHRPFGDLLASNTQLVGDIEQARALAFILIAVVSGLCLLVARILVQLAVKVVVTAKTNRVGGGVLGVVRGALIVFLMLFGISLWPSGSKDESIFEASIAGKGVRAVAPPLIDVLCGIRISVTVQSRDKAEDSDTALIPPE